MKTCKQYLIFIIYLIFPFFAGAQDVEMKILWEEEDTTFFLGNLHRVKCTYQLESEQSVKLLIKPQAPLKLLSPSSYKVNAKSGELNSASIKLYLPQTGDVQTDSLSCEFILEDLNSKALITKKKLTLEIKERVVIRMEAERTQIPMNAKDSSAMVSLKVKNMGKKKYKVGVFLQKKPDGLKIKETEKEFLIQPKSDTLIQFKIQPDKSFSNIQSAYLKYKLNTLKDGETVANASVSVFPLGFAKKYVSPNYTINNTHDFGMGFQHRGQNQNAIDVHARGQTPMYNGVVNYQMMSFYYADLGLYELSNFNLNYTRKKKTYSFGHVNFSDEVSLSGRGFTYSTETDSQSIDLGFINGSPRLFDPKFASDTPTGNSLFGRITKTSPRLGVLEGGAVLQFRESANSGVVFFTGTYKKQQHYLTGRIGLSAAQNKIDSLNNPINGGFNLNTTYERTKENWTFTSNNSLATPNYTGNLSGNIGSSNRWNYTGLKQVNLNASIRFRNTSGKVRKDDQLIHRKSNILKYQLQVEPKNLGYWRIMLSPYQTLTKRNFIDLDNPNDAYLSTSSRIQAVIGRRKKGFSVSSTGDVGFFHFGKENEAKQRFFSYRLGSKVSLNDISLNANYNRGSSLLTNALQQEGSKNEFSEFQVGARWGSWFLKRKLKLNLANQLSYSSVRELWVSSSVLKLRSMLPQNFVLETELVYYRANTFGDVFWNIRMAKKIGNYRSPEKTKKIKITLFEDLNNNAQKDEGERVLPGVFVRIEEIPFVTNDDGWVLYKSVPSGTYPISIYDPSGEMAGAQENIIVGEEDVNVDIPLYQTIPLQGKVKEIKQRFKASKFSILGVPVIAKNPQEETFTVYTKSDGSFGFNLPMNEYTVYIDPAAFGKNFEFPENFKKVELTKEGIKDLVLSIKVKSRKMKIQKF